MKGLQRFVEGIQDRKYREYLAKHPEDEAKLVEYANFLCRIGRQADKKSYKLIRGLVSHLSPNLEMLQIEDTNLKQHERALLNVSYEIFNQAKGLSTLVTA